ncbi:hypothetical protein V2D08_001054 [Campylobacter upsaliensis]|nr:hypothetical protein [Campylobacter upsaliensis]
MKKIFLCLILLFTFAQAKKQELLNFIPPEESYVNLENKKCNESCLLELLEEKMYLSFLSEFVENQNQILSNIYAKLLNSITDFEKNLQKIDNKNTISVKFALIIPEKTIKNYSNIIINSSIAYLLKQRAEIKVEVFLIGTEEEQKIKETLRKISSQGYKFAIAGFTNKGVKALENYQGDVKIFVPTTHKSTTQIHNENIYFGSIDYDAQIKKLLDKSNGFNAILSDESALLNELNSKIKAQDPNATIYKIGDEKIDFARVLRGLRGASVFFNTPLIKTALLSSQIRVHNIRTNVLFSTQLNYNPAFLSLTQEGDRRQFIIANSIDKNDEELNYLNEMFAQNLDYNWVAYATSVGLDYFYTNFLNPKSERIFEEELNNSQFIYKVRLMQGKAGNFEELE